ncbi:ComF family protein [Quadrisphaera granulorum]|uniref:ComF family protein n=1 Tax=Quadrisphaera granulorum TaxID=317664 RepID=UPI0011B732FD|nr:phosphoribosyltransferase family protein [Quadrisphaera granulorum]
MLCRTCATAVRGGGLPAALAGTTVRGAPPTWAATAYEGAVQRAVVAWKDRDRTDLSRWLGPALASSVLAALEQTEHLVPELLAPASSLSREASGPGRPASVLLVPVPSRRAAVARRGRDAVADLAAAAARGLRLQGLPVVAAPVLRPARRVRDQSGLDASGRAGNLRRALEVGPAGPRLEGRVVVLVDDVVTTGATLAEAARVLREHACPAVAAAVVAAAQRRGGGVASDEGDPGLVMGGGAD